MRITLNLLAAVAPLALAIAIALPTSARADAAPPSSEGAVRDHQTPRATIRDHRTTASAVVAPTETRLNLRVGQPLKLAGGDSLILRPGGVLELVHMNGRVARTFQNATVVADHSGAVWIVSLSDNKDFDLKTTKTDDLFSRSHISGGQRVRAGRLEGTPASSENLFEPPVDPGVLIRGHRTPQAVERVDLPQRESGITYVRFNCREDGKPYKIATVSSGGQKHSLARAGRSAASRMGALLCDGAKPHQRFEAAIKLAGDEEEIKEELKSVQRVFK